jgi:hypothetical protein
VWEGTDLHTLSITQIPSLEAFHPSVHPTHLIIKQCFFPVVSESRIINSVVRRGEGQLA